MNLSDIPAGIDDRVGHATHIGMEEAGSHHAARALGMADRAALERGMHARRVRKYRFQ